MNEPLWEPPPPSRDWLRDELIAPWWEIVLVMMLATGFFLAGSLVGLLRGSVHHFLEMIVSNRRMIQSIALESAVLGLFLLFLRRRGWRPRDFRVQVCPRATGLGFLLPIPMWLANFATLTAICCLAYLAQGPHGVAALIAASKPELHRHSLQIAWMTIVIGCVINALFEEVTCTAYFFNQVAAKHGPFAALLLTDLLRMSYHTYQGALHMLGVGAVFLVLNGFYWWSRNLWPLVVAHATADIISLALLKALLG